MQCTFHNLQQFKTPEFITNYALVPLCTPSTHENNNVLPNRQLTDLV